MNEHPEPARDLPPDELTHETLAVFDDLRERCPVAYKGMEDGDAAILGAIAVAAARRSP